MDNDNAPIHTRRIIQAGVERRDFKVMYLPALLTLSQSYWRLLPQGKSGIKRDTLKKDDSI